MNGLDRPLQDTFALEPDDDFTDDVGMMDSSVLDLLLLPPNPVH